MSTTVKTGWLNDKNGDKFAPKTLLSQIMTSDGTTLESKIENDLVTKEDMNAAIEQSSQVQIITWEADD